MNIPEGVHQFGNAMCVVKSDRTSLTRRMWLLYGGQVATMDDGTLIVSPVDEAVELDDDDAFMVWDETSDVNMFELFNVLAIAMGANRDADEAYARGRLEGENQILRQWNEVLTGTTPSTKPIDYRPYTVPLPGVSVPSPWGTGGGGFISTNPVPNTYSTTKKTSSYANNWKDDIGVDDKKRDAVFPYAANTNTITPERFDGIIGDGGDVYGMTRADVDQVLKDFANRKEEALLKKITTG